MEGASKKTLFIRNLPFSTSNEALEELFSEYGPIKSCFVVKDKATGNCRGFGYVKYSMKEDAEAAKQNVKSISGRKPLIVFADKKPKQKKKGKAKANLLDDDSDSDEEDPGDKDAKNNSKERDQQEHSSHTATKLAKLVQKQAQTPADKEKHQALCTVVVKNFDKSTFDADIKPVLSGQKNQRKITHPAPELGNNAATVLFKSKRDAFKAVKRLDKLKVKSHTLKAALLPFERRQTLEGLQQAKKCRLIIRNLSFKITDESLKEAFSKYGQITDINIPKKPDGKMLGFGFVQFSSIEQANRALQGMNAKPILNRPVAVDWAVAKNKFEQITKKNPAVKKESSDSGSFSSSGDDGEAEKEEHSERSDTSAESSDGSVTSEEEDDDGSHEDQSDPESLGEDSDREKGSSEEEEEEEEDEEEIEDGSDTDDEGFSDDEDVKSKQPPRKSDVDQGRTLFIRNLSYDTEEEDLCEFFEQYGKLNYGRVVMDPETEHSRGTAFVQFKSKEDAEKALAAASDNSKPVMLDGRRLSLAVALTKEKATKLETQKKKKEEKDSRNLYLAREGLIRVGTQAAEGLSSGDLNMRSKLETSKRVKLKDPNYFISNSRLSIHNIPVSTEDIKLRKVFLMAAKDKSAKITECRIMRDMTRVNSKGEGKSRGFGFVNFSEHQHALEALRSTNNNPELFGDKRRLIVEFSVENRSALAAKEKRLERVKAKQETFQKGKTTFAEVRTKKRNRDQRQPTHAVDFSKAAQQVDDSGDKMEEKKRSKGMPSHWGPKTRHRDKGKQPAKKNQDRNRTDARQQPTQKRKASSEPKAIKPKKISRKGEVRDNLDHLVAKYRQQFTTAYTKGRAAADNKSKWFDS